MRKGAGKRGLAGMRQIRNKSGKGVGLGGGGEGGPG